MRREPRAGLPEIIRALQPGGAHNFIVPISHRPNPVLRVDDDGAMLMNADYHGNPVRDGRALVVRESRDVVDCVQQTCAMKTKAHRPAHTFRGVAGEMCDL